MLLESNLRDPSAAPNGASVADALGGSERMQCSPLAGTVVYLLPLPLGRPSGLWVLQLTLTQCPFLASTWTQGHGCGEKQPPSRAKDEAPKTGAQGGRNKAAWTFLSWVPASPPGLLASSLVCLGPTCVG